MSTRVTKFKENQYIGTDTQGLIITPTGHFMYDSPWATGQEGLYALPKEIMAKIFNELDPASQTAAAFTARAFKEIQPPVRRSTTFCEDAVQEGLLELVRWGIESGYRPCGMIATAVKEGNLDLFKSIERLVQWIDLYYLKLAVQHKRLNILQWLYGKMGPKMLDPELFENALLTGDLDILNWLKEKGCPLGPIFGSCFWSQESRTWFSENYDSESMQPK